MLPLARSNLKPCTPPQARQQIQKLTTAYLKFLDDAVAAYRRLVWKMQWVWGPQGAAVEVDASVQNEIRQAVPAQGGGVGGARDVRPSVHRSLIYLGDLCRYQSQVRGHRVGRQGRGPWRGERGTLWVWTVP